MGLPWGRAAPRGIGRNAADDENNRGQMSKVKLRPQSPETRNIGEALRNRRKEDNGAGKNRQAGSNHPTKHA